MHELNVHHLPTQPLVNILEAEMSYDAAIAALHALMPELAVSPGQPRRKFSLDEVRILLGALGSPERQFPTLLIAGTNGKGSTASTLASILNASGYRTGLYTSPHLERVNERIRIGADEISDEAFARHFFRVNAVAESLVEKGELPQPPSFFELLTVLCFSAFAEAQIQIAVLEVGLGGRLDATNVVEPILSILTDISLDHTEWLGPDLRSIAREKAGILRAGRPMITLPQHPEANTAIGEVAMELGVVPISAAALVAGPERTGAYELQVLGELIAIDSPLVGEHQHRNIALAIAAATELAENQGFSKISASSIEAGIRQTIWPARLETIVSRGANWLLDVAHNPAGAWALRAALRTAMRDDSKPVLVFSCLRDKPLTELAQILFPLFDRIVLAPIHSIRANPMEALCETAAQLGVEPVVASSVKHALEAAAQLANGETIVVSGSVYLVGEARSILLSGEEGAQ